MNDANLIQATAVQTMSSREIADLTGKRHDNVMRDIRTMLIELHGEEGLLSFEASYTNEQNKQQPCFMLPKRETLILVSGYSVQMRAKIIDRWQELETQAATPAPVPAQAFQIPATLAEALRLAADQCDRADKAESALAVAAPKAEALDRIATAEGSLCLTDAAKELQRRPKDVITWMSANKWIYKRAGSASWIAYQDRIQAGLLEHKSHIVLLADGTERIRDQVRVTAKGLARLAECIQAEAA